MKIREWVSRLNLVQQAIAFKVIASVVVIALAAAAFSVYYVSVTVPAAREAAALRAEMALTAPQPASDEERQYQSALLASQRVLDDIAARRASPANVALGVAGLSAVALSAIWLNLGLTYLALLLLAGVVLGPMWLISDTTWAAERRWSRTTTVADLLSSISVLLSGLLALAASFIALMQGARVLLSGSNPVTAVARNVLIEAVRMKISLVFIVMLVFALAALPLVLDPSTPLRYRVQSFLQYGTGGSFWIIAVLTLFFSVSSVASEQRDRQIWQTMTKPVSSAQYLLGKWLGVVTLNAVLLAVCCAGVFLFTEYLRKQPAEGERLGLVSNNGEVSRDRMLLETQVLTARAKSEPEPPVKATDQEFLNWVKFYIDEQRASNPDFAREDAQYQEVASDLYKSYVSGLRSILTGDSKRYVFTGLSEAKRLNVPLTLRYVVDSGSNDPSVTYKVTFVFGGTVLPPQEVGLGIGHTLTLYPNVIDDKGTVHMEIVNGALVQTESGGLVPIPNPDMITFPKDGLQLFHTAGSYQANFFRVALALWVKLAFLSMLAITASTFLSFPVACLIAFSAFLGAEGAGFLKTSLEYYDASDMHGNVNPAKLVIRGIGTSVTWMFGTYNELRPTKRLVDGRLLSWEHISWGTGVLVVWTGVLYGMGVAIFRRRELATYSGN